MQMYDNFEGFPEKNSASSLGWFHIMTPVQLPPAIPNRSLTPPSWLLRYPHRSLLDLRGDK